MASSLLLTKPPTTSALAFSASISNPSPYRRPSTRLATPTRKIPAVQAKIREIFMPALSSTMTEGKIVSWIKSEGDSLSKGDSVVVVESDKADMDVESFYDGVLAAIVVSEGETAPVGAPIGLLAETEAEIELAKAMASNKTSPDPSVAPNSNSNLDSNSPPPAEKLEKLGSPVAATAGTGTRKKSVATPYAKKLAKQHRIEIGGIEGTGAFGRVTPGDVEAAAGISPSKASFDGVGGNVGGGGGGGGGGSAPKAAAAVAAPVLPGIPGSTVTPFTTMQAAVAKNMVESLSVPTFRVGYPVVTDALDAFYAKVKAKGVTMTALLAKAAAMALGQHPVVNAGCKDGKSFIYNDSINIAVAVAINGGLITPVLQDADKLDLYLLSQKWKELVEKARSKQLQPHEYNSGITLSVDEAFVVHRGTFTLSNLGMFGVDRFDAILPPGQGAIMAVGASKPTVVADADGFFSVKNKMLVNVTADHRIIYGADLASFLQTFVKIVENPDSLTL
ncbi:hypothetical protein Syun_021696 [Stephania yunnanensis]|uniref:Dihydrolipoamide acetyltransferase component of pyruvate dehydrogenase complex n=1 Tax=Stephania yunnanensis TaxID=152371 RepID=A0AAP0IG22_9MAGN